MKIIDPMYADDRSARLRIDEPDDDGSGPQGAALILELQRLRQAFELENQPESNRPQPRRAPPDGQRPPGRRPRQVRPKRSRKKGKMGRVLDAWLGPFGFQADAPDGDAPAARGSQAVHEPEFASPPRARGPIIAPDDPSHQHSAARTQARIEAYADACVQACGKARAEARTGGRAVARHAGAASHRGAPSGPVDFGRRRRFRTSHRADGR